MFDFSNASDAQSSADLAGQAASAAENANSASSLGDLSGLDVTSPTPSPLKNLGSGSDKLGLGGTLLAMSAGPAITSIGQALQAKNNPQTKLAQAQLEQNQRQFEAELALKQAQLQQQKDEAGAAKKLKLAELALQKKLARAKMIQAAYEGLATSSQSGRNSSANALQRIVDNIQLPFRRSYSSGNVSL